MTETEVACGWRDRREGSSGREAKGNPRWLPVCCRTGIGGAVEGSPLCEPLCDVEADENESVADNILLGESRGQAAVIGTPNQMEAVMAQMEKRTANFSE